MNNQQSNDENSGTHTVQGRDPDLLSTSDAVGLLLLLAAGVGLALWLIWSRVQ